MSEYSKSLHKLFMQREQKQVGCHASHSVSTTRHFAVWYNHCLLFVQQSDIFISKWKNKLLSTIVIMSFSSFLSLVDCKIRNRKCKREKWSHHCCDIVTFFCSTAYLLYCSTFMGKNCLHCNYSVASVHFFGVNIPLK